MEAAGVELARRQIAAADLVLWVLDATTLPSEVLKDPRSVLAWRQAEADALLADVTNVAPMVTVLNKIDAVANSEACEETSRDFTPVSARSGTGIDSLLATIATILVPVSPPAGAGVPFTVEQVAQIEDAKTRPLGFQAQ